jgi:hypothetical protein
MLPVAVDAGAGLSAGVEDIEAFAPAPLVEVADGDPAVHPLKAMSKLAAATSAAKRCAVFSN